MLENIQYEQKIMSDLIVNTKYSRYDPALDRREVWEEIIDRNKQMHLRRFANNKKVVAKINDVYANYVLPMKVVPSMRSLQFGGAAIERSPNRIYNCAFMPIENIRAFSEAMFLLLGGTGVGYSVQRHHVAKLPQVIKPNPDRTYRHLIGDSQEGWAEAIHVLFQCYTGMRTTTPRFDYSDIRPKGTPLKTSGGKAPGPTPLRNCLTIIEGMLIDMHNFHQLKPIEVHDMMCHIADAVLSGGIRRSAMISLFSADDREMLTAKSGQYWRSTPWRGRANNSIVLMRNRVTKKYFNELFEIIKSNGGMEPGMYFTNDKDWGTNPCAEIGLRPYQFCNLSECNVSDVDSQEELNARVEAATFLGTLQAHYTDFHYIRTIWKETTERDALLGVSMTGIASGAIEELDLKEAVDVAKITNNEWADELGINRAARVSCVKPAGTSSLVLGTSSGIHAWHSDYFIRTIRYNKEEPIVSFLQANVPELVQEDKSNANQVVVLIPQKAPDGAITREESAIDFLERVKRVSEDWVAGGHNDGMNSHNVSATINVREAEWDLVRDWMWINRECYNGLSMIGYIYDLEDGIEQQMPLTACDKETYQHYLNYLDMVDFKLLREYEDNTNLQGELACAGGVCEI
jgi:ribonucleoside-diphosphate reductase alpha chain